MHAFMDASPAGTVAVAIVFQGKVHQMFKIRDSLLQMWGNPRDHIHSAHFRHLLLTPEEERRMHREFLYHVSRDMLFPVSPWFFKNCVPFRTLGEQKPFLMIDSGLNRP